MKTLVLASASPRRRTLLSLLDVPWVADPANVPEEVDGDTPSASALATMLAERKARAVAARREGGLVLGADTVVALDGRVFGKPSDAAEARWMLRQLRGRSHEVVTGVALADAASGALTVACRESRVTMRDYGEDEMEAYVASGEAMDKAGAYGVQDTSFSPASHVLVCYANVIGLPLCTVATMLEEQGVTVHEAARWQPSSDSVPCSGCRELAVGEALA